MGNVAWYLKSGPGNPFFTAATAPLTQFSVDTPGVYDVCAVWTDDLPDTGSCAFQPQLVDGLCPSGIAPTYVEWSVVPPFPANPQIFSPNQFSTFINTDVPGDYLFEFKCYHYGPLGSNPGTAIITVPIPPVYPPAVGNPNQYNNAALSCPIAVIAGQTAGFTLYGCEGEAVAWTITGPQGVANQVGNTGASYGTGLLDTGTVDVVVVCTNVDTGAVRSFNCSVPIIPFDPLLGLWCETVTYPLTFDDCGAVCRTATASLTFIDCDAIQCTEAYVTLRAGEAC